MDERAKVYLPEGRRDGGCAAVLRALLILVPVILGGLFVLPCVAGAESWVESAGPEPGAEPPGALPDTGDLAADDAMEAPVPEMRSPRPKRQMGIVLPESTNEERAAPAPDAGATSQVQEQAGQPEVRREAELPESPAVTKAPKKQSKTEKPPPAPVPQGNGTPSAGSERTATGGGNDIRDIRWGKHGSFERVVFEVYEDWQSERALGRPGDFEIDYETHPYRLVVRLEGVWSVSSGWPSFRNSGIVESMHRIQAHGGRSQVLVITLKKPVAYKAYTMGEPARVVIDLSEQKPGPVTRPMFSLRTLSYRETTYRLWETLGAIMRVLSSAAGSEARVVQSGDHTFFVEEGLYRTREEAEDVKAVLMKQGYRLHVEKRGPGDIPGAVFDEKTR